MKKLRRSVLALLLGAALFTETLGTSCVEASASTKAWYDDLEVTLPSFTESDGYVTVDDGEETPTVSESLGKGLKGAATLPTAYMNSLEQITAKYPSVRNQGDYNTCWAFSAVGLAEFDLIADNQTADKSIDLSEYQVSYFTYHTQVDLFGGTVGDSLNTRTNYLLTGGNLDFASRTLLQWLGVTSESLMPYGLASAYETYSSSYAYAQDLAHLQNAYIINIHTNQAALKQEIMNHGSAGIGLYVATTTRYDKQVTYEKTGETVTTYNFPYTGYEPNHALNIVGWDDDFPASSFASTPEGNGAWLVRNSWSDTSENDINSYFWISYYDKGIEDEAWILDFESADNYDYNYQYDGGSVVYGLNGLLRDVNVKNYANVFQVQGSSNEMLRAVQIALNDDTNMPYTIQVYANLTDPSKPKSGILAATQTGTTTYAGTYTIPLDAAVSLPKGSYYSVVVTLGKDGVGIDTEFSADYPSVGLSARAYAAANQSFIYYSGAWHDMADLASMGLGNLCIKAFTDATGTSVSQTKSLKSASIKKTSVKLSWAKTSGATGYQIYRATTKNGTYTKVATVKTTSYTNTKLKANTIYYYKVRAYKKSGGTTVFGKLSSAVKIKTLKK